MKSALRRFWALALITALTSTLIVAAYAARIQPTYTASTVVSVGPRSDATGSAALFTLLATKYVAFAAGDSLSASLATDFDVPRTVLLEGLQVRLQERTTNINISMTTDSATLSQMIAGAVSTSVENRAAADPLLQAQIVVPASRTNVIERTGRVRLLGIGVLASLGFGALVAVIASRVSRYRAIRRTW